MDFSHVNPTAPSSSTYEPLPNGTYAVTVTSCEQRDYNGQYFIALRYTVADGTYRGRIINSSIWGMWDDDNRRAMQTWAALRVACGLDGRIGGDYPDVVGRFLKVDVETYFKRNGQQGNKITGYHPLPQPAPQAQQPPLPTYIPQQPAQAQQYQQPVQPQGGIDEVPF